MPHNDGETCKVIMMISIESLSMKFKLRQVLKLNQRFRYQKSNLYYKNFM